MHSFFPSPSPDELCDTAHRHFLSAVEFLGGAEILCEDCGSDVEDLTYTKVDGSHVCLVCLLIRS